MAILRCSKWYILVYEVIYVGKKGKNLLVVIMCAAWRRLSFGICDGGGNYQRSITWWKGLVKHAPSDLKHIFIMKISKICLWNDEGVRGCCVPSIVCHDGLHCFGLACSKGKS